MRHAPDSGATKKGRVPYQYKPEQMTYEEWQIALRRQFAMEQRYQMKNIGDHPVYSDFKVSSPQSKQTYKVAIRGAESANFCSCPDFAVNTLGTCKHIEYVLHHLKKKAGLKKLFHKPYVQSYTSVYLRYGKERQIILRIGSRRTGAIERLADEYFDTNLRLRMNAFDCFEVFVEKVFRLDPAFRCYKDALDYIVALRDARRRERQIAERYPEGKKSPALSSLVNTELHPYQKEAVLFAATVGRCIIADEMGLGKTIEAIAAAELMAKEFGVERVLIVCPTSLKYQWKSEIERFTVRTPLVIEGVPAHRRQQYIHPEFFTILSYDTVKTDLSAIEQMAPDLVILDEAQRIKNWKTKTAQTVKQIRSEYAIVLTGTPLENRLEELHSITAFIDPFRLGPLFRFLADHQIVDEHNKVIGYKELHKVANTIAPILIRRTKKDVLKELPERVDKHVYVEVTSEQRDVHDEHQGAVSKLVNKWKKYKFLSEKERQMLLIHLNCMRMVSDSTFVLDETTRHDTKIDELMAVLDELFAAGEAKAVVFSQWERMARLVAETLQKRNIGYAFLHGGVPSRKRKDLLTDFHATVETRVFLSTDAGSVGLNLQCASVLINLDCPWNPAVLEQRIGRVHRMGQKRPVTVINFISSGTIEEMIQATLVFKKSVFDGVLNNGADEVFMGESKFRQFIKTVEAVVVPEDHRLDTLSVQKADRVPAEPLLTTADAASFKLSSSAVTGTDQTAPHTKGAGTGTVHQPTLDELFTLGLNFLEQVHHHITEHTNGTTDSFSIEKNENTGKSSLKIPLPQKATLEKVASILNALAVGLKEK